MKTPRAASGRILSRFAAQYTKPCAPYPQPEHHLKVFLAGTSLRHTYGGPAYSVSRLASALASEGVAVGLWAPDQSAADAPLLPRDSGVQRLTGSASEALNTFGDPDIVHDSGIWREHNHRLATLARKRGIPRIVSTRGMLEPWALNHKRLKKRLAWHLYQKSDLQDAAYHHATTTKEAEGIRTLRLGVPVCVVPNGVDLPELSNAGGAKPSTRIALFLGRIYPVKGLPMLIEAWSRVRPKGWRLRIVGPDEAGHLTEVKNAVRGAELYDAVEFGSAVEGSAKHAELMAADLFILPSHSESFGMAVGEALSYSVPVLATTAVPWPELSDEGCGWRVNPDAASLAAGVRTATNMNRTELRAMGDRGRALIARKYQWGEAARSLISVYASLSEGTVPTASSPGSANPRGSPGEQ